MSGNSIMQRLRNTPAQSTQLRTADFSTSEGTANQRTKIAEVQAETPTFLRPDAALRLAFVAVEEFQTDGTGSNTETFNLSNDIIETPNTDNIELYKGSTRVQPDSVDYANNTFDFTDSGTGNYLHAFYVPRDATRIDIERQAPRSQGNVSDVVYDDVSSLLHERDQNQEPAYFDGDHPLDLVLPRKWKLQVYADGPVAFAYDDSETANSQGVSANNALLKVPVRKASGDIPGLATAVKRRIIDPSS